MAWSGFQVSNSFSDALKTAVGKRFVLSAVGISTLVAFFATVVQIFWEFRVVNDRANERLNQIEELHAPMLVETLWILDDPLTEIHLTSILTIPDIASVTLKRPHLEPLIFDKPEKTIQAFSIERNIALNYNHQDRQEYLGSINVVLSLKNAITTISRRVLFLLGMNFLKTLIVAFFLMIVFHRLIGRHLVDISRTLSGGNFQSSLPMELDRKRAGKKDELDLLVDSYNGAIKKLGTSLDALEKSNIELTAAKNKAEEMTSAKSLFLGNISHELRTPLAALDGFIDVLESDDLSLDQKKHALTRMKHNSTTLQKLIDELLDLTKIEGKNIQPAREKCQIRTLLTEVVQEFDHIVRKKGLTFSTEFSPEVPDQILSDQAMLTKIVRNIVGNAVKFTASGTIFVKVSIRTPSLLIIEVKDFGIGIKDDARERIFDEFAQQDESIARYFGGTGLGLAMSRRMARILGGDVTLLESNLNQGSTFSIALPILEHCL